ncbi:OmpA family protein [Synechococcus elongatus]|uniref:Flagellar motor protein n=1 Tax=Synechococcus elongatus PCC 11802 TaxID=2283154 RepID=A0AAT9K1F5_SYNEL|nr:flagellar motor protein [Synechococcus elongatus PCC 11802]
MTRSIRNASESSEDLNVWPIFTDLLANAFLILTTFLVIVLLLPLLQGNDETKRQGPPPIITLPESESFRFSSGSAQLSPAFQASLRKTLIPQIEQLINDYDIDVVELIGHTDGQPNPGTGNLDTLINRSPASRLVPGSNADLGLMRSLAVVQYLQQVQKKDKKFQGVQFRAYSAGSLFLPSGKPAPASNANQPERRRIEIRFTRLGQQQTLGQ